MAVEVAEGGTATVRFDGSRCIHARRCVTGLPAVFRAGVKGAWIHPDAAGAEELARVVLACPSGALSLERRDGGAQEAPPRANTVTVRENGPLAVHAELTVAGHGPMTRATLCRCGLSRTKPFCDNSHLKAGFAASGEPASRDAMALAITDLTGPVTVTPRPNGPLVVVGRFEIESGTGRAIDRVEKAVFCRCGNSQNKPFCDGSHKRVGFEAP